jgi:hypothetical protein
MLLCSHLILRPVGLVQGLGWARHRLLSPVPTQRRGSRAEAPDPATLSVRNSPRTRTSAAPTGRAVPEWTRDCDLTRWMAANVTVARAPAGNLKPEG